VVIHDLSVVRIAVTPREADAPLVVDSNAICARTVAFQQLQLVSRKHAKIFQLQCPMQVRKLPPRGPFDGLKSPNPVVLKERRGVWALEGPDQISAYDVAGIMPSVIAACRRSLHISHVVGMSDNARDSTLANVLEKGAFERTMSSVCAHSRAQFHRSLVPGGVITFFT